MTISKDEPLEGEEFVTDEFSIPQGKFLIALLARFGKIIIVSLCVAAMAGMTMGVTYDYRYALVAMMLIFIVMPMTMVMLYMVYATRFPTCLNTPLHKIKILRGDKIEVVISESEQIYTYSFSQIKDVEYYPSRIIITFLSRGKESGFLIVPNAAIPEGAKFNFNRR